jgi:hypothetical protein
MHIAAAMKRGREAAVRATLLFHAGLTGLLIVLAANQVISWWVLAAFALAVGRALVGVWRLSPVLRIKRLGWTEVAYSLVYAVALVLAIRQPL